MPTPSTPATRNTYFSPYEARDPTHSGTPQPGRRSHGNLDSGRYGDNTDMVTPCRPGRDIAENELDIQAFGVVRMKLISRRNGPRTPRVENPHS